MNNLAIAYAVYLVLTAAITIFVANYLFKNGKTFLMNAFNGNEHLVKAVNNLLKICLLYTSPSPRDKRQSRMPSSA